MKKIIYVLLIGLLMIAPTFAFAVETTPTYIGPPITVEPNPYIGPPPCVDLTSYLFYGSRDSSNGQVSTLQSFLTRNGYGSFGATGYFGPLTQGAVIKFQTRYGITAQGFVGPITRAKIREISCGPSPSNVSLSSLTPSSGGVGTQVTLYGSGFTSTGNTVNFGSGAIPNVPSNPTVSSSNTTSLTFRVPDSLNPACSYQNPPCLGLATWPVTPGKYPVSVTNSNGTSNSLTFTVNSLSATNQTPVITDVSAPTSLNVNQTGTWKVTASDPQNRQLTYSVNWGDSVDSSCTDVNSPCARATSVITAFQQSTTFTHVYSKAGIYTQTFTVKNSIGLTAQTSTSVQVVNPSSTINRVSVVSITPTAGPVGTHVTISGSGFTSTGNKVNISGGEYYNLSNLSSSNGNTLSFDIPANTDYACFHTTPQCDLPVYMTTLGQHTIWITNTNGTSNSLYFNVTAPRF